MNMKEPPILFSAPMVRAILDGRKTQTRRVVKPQPVNVLFHKGQWIEAPCDLVENETVLHCPYGQPGDRLWVRETWAHETDFGTFTGGFVYRADGDKRERECGPTDRWRPSIHMPRLVSRITLEITDVRVERIKDISGIDAIAEGIQAVSKYGSEADVSDFAELWDKINGKKYPWESNPFVWRIEFKRIGG
jgi:hypothetical protein